jgi:hypothetical protein
LEVHRPESSGLPHLDVAGRKVKSAGRTPMIEKDSSSSLTT